MKNLSRKIGLAVVALALAAAAAEATRATYLVSAPHTPEQCLAALDEFAAKNPKLLSKMEWGCMDGDHTGYARVQAASTAEAIGQLPENQRATAKAVRLGKFTPAQIKGLHHQ